MIIHLIDRSAAKGQAREEMIDSLLVTAEEKAGERFWVVHEQAAPRDPAMQLRRDESGLLSHNGKLLPKSGQELFYVLMLHQEGAEEDYRRNVVYDLLVKAHVWVHLNELGPWAGLLPAGIAFRGERRIERQDWSQCRTD